MYGQPDCQSMQRPYSNFLLHQFYVFPDSFMPDHKLASNRRQSHPFEDQKTDVGLPQRKSHMRSRDRHQPSDLPDRYSLHPDMRSEYQHY